MESNFLIIIPFILLLLSISFVPLLDKKFWKKYYAVISFSLAALVALFYFIVLKDFSGIISSIEEYLSFIVLLFSLFVISGGVFFNIRGDASPEKNVLLLAGSVAANIFGTTGAAMLLIRPFLISNMHHLKPYHIVFFIERGC